MKQRLSFNESRVAVYRWVKANKPEAFTLKWYFAGWWFAWEYCSSWFFMNIFTWIIYYMNGRKTGWISSFLWTYWTINFSLKVCACVRKE